jgi:hypothetical protein
MTRMKHPLSRYASPPSLAFGGRGVVPMARQSRFHGTLGLRCFMACVSRSGAVDN